MGYLHLSFEYHKETLKVRVWQVSDLLLPPPQLSMIHSIFVRGYFIPDKARKTLRRTEDILIDLPQMGGTETPKTGIQHIFTPSSFKFRNPLQYRAVSETIVKERSLQLEVCMTQKRTRRPFLMAMVHLPLSTAVRRPIRDQYPLIPCMNLTIPNNMRVYSAAQLQLESSKGSDSPSIRRTESARVATPVTAREVELEDVVSLSGEDFLRSHLSLCLDEDSDGEEKTERLDDNLRLKEVVVGNGVGSGGSSTTTLNLPSSSGEDEDDQDMSVVVVADTRRPRSTPIDMSGVDNSVSSATKKKIIPNELLVRGTGDVAVVTMPSEDVVVDLEGLSSAESSSASESLAGNSTHKKKIIPPGLEKDSVMTGHVRENGREDIPHDRIHDVGASKHKVTGSPIKGTSPRRNRTMVLPGDASTSTPSARRHNTSVSSTGSEGVSPRGRRDLPLFSPLQDFCPASRPETPCWDFYDWAEDLEEMGLEGSGEGGGGVLEEGLAQLKALGLMGDVQPVVSKEPILPVDLADDFDSLAVDGAEQAAGDSEQTAVNSEQAVVDCEQATGLENLKAENETADET